DRRASDRCQACRRHASTHRSRAVKSRASPNRADPPSPGMINELRRVPYSLGTQGAAVGDAHPPDLSRHLLGHALARWRGRLGRWGGRLDRLCRRERGHRYLPFADPFDLTDPHLLSSCSFTWTRTSGYFRISASAVSVSGAISSRMTTHSARHPSVPST